MLLQGSPTGQAAWPRRNKVRGLALAWSIGSLTGQWVRLHILLRLVAQLICLVLGRPRMDGFGGLGRSNN